MTAIEEHIKCCVALGMPLKPKYHGVLEMALASSDCKHSPEYLIIFTLGVVQTEKVVIQTQWHKRIQIRKYQEGAVLFEFGNFFRL